MPDGPTQKKQVGRAFTLRSIFFGLLGGAILIIGAAVFGKLLKQGDICNSPLPLLGVAYLMVLSLVWNPVISRFLPFLRLSVREMVVVAAMTITMTIMGGPVSGGTMFEQLPQIYRARGINPKFEKFEMYDYIPSKLLPLGGEVDETVYGGLRSGLSENPAEYEWIKLKDVPIEAWLPTMKYWAPLASFLFLVFISLALLLHRQWAVHEQLSYPLASVVGAVFARGKDRLVPDLFRSRLFWAGFGIAFFVLFYNYIQRWYPTVMDPITLTWNLNLAKYFPILAKVNFRNICTGPILFYVLGLAYLVDSKVSLSVGVNYFFMAIFVCVVYTFTGKVPTGHCRNLAGSGAFFSYFIFLIILGRHYYGSVFRKAVGLGGKMERNPEGVMGARVFLLSLIGLNVVMVIMGFDWLIALVVTLTYVVLITVYARIACETGMPVFGVRLGVADTLTKMLGNGFFGARGLTTTFVLGKHFLGIAAPPAFMLNAFKLAEDHKVRIKKLAYVLLGTFVVATALSFTIWAWYMYSFGGGGSGRYTAFNPACSGIVELDSMNLYEETKDVTGLGHIKYITTSPQYVRYVLFGMAIAATFAFMRIRYNWWPFHPLIFLIWGGWGTMQLATPFFFGWMIKQLVVKSAGGKMYNKLKPFFIGLILAPASLALISAIVSIIYHASEKTIPRAQKISYFFGWG
jgi:hypothetical protein